MEQFGCEYFLELQFWDDSQADSPASQRDA